MIISMPDEEVDVLAHGDTADMTIITGESHQESTVRCVGRSTNFGYHQSIVHSG